MSHVGSWRIALSPVTLGILWNKSTLSVYVWRVSALLGATYSALAFGPMAEQIYPTAREQYLLASTAIGNAWLKALSIRLTRGDRDLTFKLKIGACLLGAHFFTVLNQSFRMPRVQTLARRIN